MLDVFLPARHATAPSVHITILKLNGDTAQAILKQVKAHKLFFYEIEEAATRTVWLAFPSIPVSDLALVAAPGGREAMFRLAEKLRWAIYNFRQSRMGAFVRQHVGAGVHAVVVGGRDGHNGIVTYSRHPSRWPPGR